MLPAPSLKHAKFEKKRKKSKSLTENKRYRKWDFLSLLFPSLGVGENVELQGEVGLCLQSPWCSIVSALQFKSLFYFTFVKPLEMSLNIIE